MSRGVLTTEEEYLYRDIKQDGRYGLPHATVCVAPPLGCGKKLTPIVARAEDDGREWDNPPLGHGRGFRDLVSLREWQITGLCQACQDEIEKSAEPV